MDVPLKTTRPRSYSEPDAGEGRPVKEIWGKKQIVVGAILVLAGTMSTMCAKWTDKTKVKLPGEKEKDFRHPLLQTMVVFLGELMCLVIYVVYKYVRRWRTKDASIPLLDTSGWPKSGLFIFLPPALCDFFSTYLQYLGLNLIDVASFQMLRSTALIFTGVLSILAFKTPTYCYRWLGMILIVAGMVLISVADVLRSAEGVHVALAGDVLVVLSQALVATQIIYEQKYVFNYSINPFLAVGMEGVFGTVICAVMLLPMHYIRTAEHIGTGPDNRLEDLSAAFDEIHHAGAIAVPLVGLMVAAMMFKPAGVSVGAEMSGVTRTVLDSSRIILVYVISLSLRWQLFSYIQLIGCFLIILAVLIYNDVLIGPTAVRRFVDSSPRFGSCCADFCFWYYKPAVHWQTLHEEQVAQQAAESEFD